MKIDSPLKSIGLGADYAEQVVSSVTSYGVTTNTTNKDRKIGTKREPLLNSRLRQILNSSSQKARVFFPFPQFVQNGHAIKKISTLIMMTGPRAMSFSSFPWPPELSTLVSDRAVTPLTN